jgi:hypothetical protein
MGKFVDTFRVFESRYQTYQDYSQGRMKWGSPEELKQDALLKARQIIPASWEETLSQVKSAVDQSSDTKGIKIEISLASGDTLHLYKTEPMRGDWEVYLNRKAMRSDDQAKAALMKGMSPLNRYLYAIAGYDHTHAYSDSGRVYDQGVKQAAELRSLYSGLSAQDKKRAYQEFEGRFKTGSEFAQFTGA